MSTRSMPFLSKSFLSTFQGNLQYDRFLSRRVLLLTGEAAKGKSPREGGSREGPGEGGGGGGAGA